MSSFEQAADVAIVTLGSILVARFLKQKLYDPEPAPDQKITHTVDDALLTGLCVMLGLRLSRSNLNNNNSLIIKDILNDKTITNEQKGLLIGAFGHKN